MAKLISLPNNLLSPGLINRARAYASDPNKESLGCGRLPNFGVRYAALALVEDSSY
jgi:hypothetical protein